MLQSSARIFSFSLGYADKKSPALGRAFLSCLRSDYFCCSLGLSAGFGVSPWVCCCGVAAGAGVAGFCGSEAEMLTIVMVISLHEKKQSRFFSTHLTYARRMDKQGIGACLLPDCAMCSSKTTPASDSRTI
jgi:hypothetical protein